MPQSALVLYHADCIDGFAAAWVAHQALIGCAKSRRDRKYEIELRAVRYGEAAPERDEVYGKDVYILDFSYPRAEMEQLIATVRAGGGILICLDHHATAEKALTGLEGCYFKQDISGAMMAWLWFHNGFYGAACVIPELIRRVSDNDTGQRKLRFASEFNALIGSYPFELEAYDELAWNLDKLPLAALIDQGAAVRREQKKRVDLTLGLAVDVELAGRRCLVANTSDQAQFSSVGVTLAERAESGVGGCYFVRADGQVEWSLRSLRPEHAERVGRASADVSEVALFYGGGGHRHAAGFVSGLEKLEEILTSAHAS